MPMTLLWMLLYCIAEIIIPNGYFAIGIGIDLGLLSVTLLLVLIQRRKSEEAALVGVSLLAFQRLMSVSAPVNVTNDALWYGFAGVPILVAVILANRAYFGRLVPYVRGKATLLGNLAIALLGIPAAVAAFYLVRPTLPNTATDTAGFILHIIAIFLFTGVLQELLYRGLLQTASEKLGIIGVLIISVMAAVSNLGNYSPLLCGVVFVLSLVLGLIYQRFHSLLGTVLASSLFVTLYLIVLPAVIR